MVSVAYSVTAPCLIIAEAGVNHNGSEEMSFRLVEAAREAGADVVKFQTYKTEKLVTRSARKAAYQQAQTGEGQQFTMLKQLELSEAAHQRLAEHCHAIGIEFLSTPFDEESTDFLIALGCRRLKVPSGELTNHPFLRFLASKGLPMILSTGMADLQEVAEATRVIADTRQACGLPEPIADRLTLLHCTSSYPTAPHDVNLLAMRTLANHFHLPAGYSDHTANVFVAPLARALGACVFEKHMTLDRTLPGPDHAASLEPDEFKALVQAIRMTDVVLGCAEKRPTRAELAVRIAARRSVTLARGVAAGQVLVREDLALMRPGDGIPPCELDSLVGRIVREAMQVGSTLRHEDLQP